MCLGHTKKTPPFLSPYITTFAKHTNESLQLNSFSINQSCYRMALLLEKHPGFYAELRSILLCHKQRLNLNRTYLFVCHYYKSFSGL